MKHIKLFEEYSFSSDEINKIVYGNPTKENYEIAYETDSSIKDWFISEGIADEIIAKSPSNDSAITKKDLQSLASNKITADDLSFARYVDDVSNMAQTYIDLLQEKGIEMTMGEFFSVDSQLEPLVFWLKDKINRPRPYQLSKAFNLPIYPLIHTDAMSAAYPSGHATSAFLMGEYLSNKYSQHRVEIMELSERIAKSRELTLIHYSSDTEISREIVKIVFKNNLINNETY